ncbi:MAG: ComEA family DNA-binding protein [Candidatus Omnitrophota bacterium]
MFSLTSYERKVLIFIAALICCGAVLKVLHVNLSRQKAAQETKEIVSTHIQNKNIPAKQIIINVNTASQEELQALPGVGPEIARRIIEYRQRHGHFLTLGDLEKVKGIGVKKREMIKDRISF